MKAPIDTGEAAVAAAERYTRIAEGREFARNLFCDVHHKMTIGDDRGNIIDW